MVKYTLTSDHGNTDTTVLELRPVHAIESILGADGSI